MLQNNLARGISFASVNYPYIDQVNGDHRKLLEHCAESIKFIKKNAGTYNIDKNRISVMGNSAGALLPAFLDMLKIWVFAQSIQSNNPRVHLYYSLIFVQMDLRS
jgi:acetyl esterase/lipase